MKARRIFISHSLLASYYIPGHEVIYHKETDVWKYDCSQIPQHPSWCHFNLDLCFSVAWFIWLRRNFRKLCRAKGCSFFFIVFTAPACIWHRKKRGKYPFTGTQFHVSCKLWVQSSFDEMETEGMQNALREAWCSVQCMCFTFGWRLLLLPPSSNFTSIYA